MGKQWVMTEQVMVSAYSRYISVPVEQGIGQNLISMLVTALITSTVEDCVSLSYLYTFVKQLLLQTCSTTQSRFSFITGLLEAFISVY